MTRDDASIFDMLIAARRVVETVRDISFDEFAGDWKTQSVVIHQLTVLGEAAKRLSSEFRDRHKNIPWRAIAGHRDILIHRYNGVDLNQVWLIATRELPKLLEFLESVAPGEEEDNNP
ncbi:MAG: DUF86 domain-containing protein [Planctomycetota bacterium]|nr:MAG: DUF86 domain-containing protein [Planctomycetota bacterium]